MFLKTTGRAIIVVGGGEQAAQKARLAIKTDANIRLVSPDLEPELQDLVSTGRASHSDPSDPCLFDDVALVFVATGCKGADAAWQAHAKRLGALVNVVDFPELCDAMTPSIVDRDPVVVAIGTEGNAPLLGRQIKTRIEQILHPRLGAFAALSGRLRKEVSLRVKASDRRDFWRWVFGETPWRLFSVGREREAINVVKSAIQSSHRPSIGHLCIVSGAQDPELLPLAAIQRLQEADEIHIERDVPEATLELARRDAERSWVEPESGRRNPRGLWRMVYNSAVDRNVVYLSRRSIVIDHSLFPKEDLPIEQLAVGQRWVDRGSQHFNLVAAS
ncbi:MAG: NAD(P)-dependent oxidoreductase [Pseudomonadota bacterium]